MLDNAEMNFYYTGTNNKYGCASSLRNIDTPMLDTMY